MSFRRPDHVPTAADPLAAARRMAPVRGRVSPLVVAVALTAGLVGPAVAVAETGPGPTTVLQADPPSAVRVAAGRGHVVAMESSPRGGSTLVELAPGRAPRDLGNFAGDVAWPTVGEDGDGRAVAVLSPCLRKGRATPLPDCSLAVVDLETGRSRFLPHSKGAYIGDLDGTRAVVARRSASSGVRLALTSGSTTTGSRSLPLGSLLPAAGDAGYPASSRYVDSLDLSGGTVAATFLWGMSNGGDGGGSILARGTTSGRGWTELAHSGYGGASGIERVFRAATVGASGIRAMYDGGDNEPSYVARWRTPGKVARQIPVEASTVTSAAFDRGRLVTVGAEGYGCSEEGGGCPVTEVGPLGLG